MAAGAREGEGGREGEREGTTESAKADPTKHVSESNLRQRMCACERRALRSRWRGCLSVKKLESNPQSEFRKVVAKILGLPWQRALSPQHKTQHAPVVRAGGEREARGGGGGRETAWQGQGLPPQGRQGRGQVRNRGEGVRVGGGDGYGSRGASRAHTTHTPIIPRTHPSRTATQQKQKRGGGGAAAGRRAGQAPCFSGRRGR